MKLTSCRLVAEHVLHYVRLHSFLRRAGWKITPHAARPTSWRSLSSSPRFLISQSPATPLPTSAGVDKDASVHPHLRPPRKLRQVAAQAQTIDIEEEALDDVQQRKRRRPQRILKPQTLWPIVSYSTAEEYNLHQLKKTLQDWQKKKNSEQDHGRYQLADAFLTGELVEDAVHYQLSPAHARLADNVDVPINTSSTSTPMSSHSQPSHSAATTTASNPMDECGDIFVFSEGSVVFWNVAKDDAQYFLNKILSPFEIKPYNRVIVQHEAEYLDYTYLDGGHVDDHDDAWKTPSVQDTAKLTSDGKIILDPAVKQTNPQLLSLIKYAFSDAIVMSVKLAIYEASLQDYVQSIENVAEDIKNKGKISLSKDQVLRKTGELFFLRHSINLGSNMLDSPDFYWDREDLESLYKTMCTYLNINRRTKIFNEKLNHCYALVELLRDHLNNQHHVRLELMIIALICVEVFFEMLHYAENYWQQRDAAIRYHNEKINHNVLSAMSI